MNPLPSLYHLSPRTVLRLSGPDRVRYLNGQATQDVRLATGERAVPACVLNAKGQLDAVCHLREEGGSFLIDAPLPLRDDLLARLDRYIIADDVELSDESGQWHVAHAVDGTVAAGGLQWESTRLDRAGTDLFSREPIALEGFADRSADDFAVQCIRSGVPAWGAELTPGLLPPDAALDLTAISYDKGCYLGQEVISRMKRAGKTNQHLVSLTVPPDTRAPCTLIHDGSEAGRITSVAAAEEDFPEAVALGFRKRKFAEVEAFDLRDDEGNPREGQARVRNAEQRS